MAIIKTFTASTNYKNYKLPSGSNPGTPQSMAILGNDTIVVAHNVGNNNKTCHLRKYTTKGYVSNSDVVYSGLGHCSGSTYCNDNGLLYITAGNGKMVAFNTNFKKQFTFTLPTGANGVAWDRAVKKFYVAAGTKVYIYPLSAFEKNTPKSGRKYTSKITTAHGVQDIGGYNGIVYRVLYKNIKLYEHTTGKCLGEIAINSYPETESVVFDSKGNFIYLTAQNRGIHWTKWRPQYKAGSIVTTPGNQSVKASTAFVRVAKNEVGTKESGNNNVKYNTWFYGHAVSGDNYAWCAAFIAWCAKQALGNNNTIPKNAGAGTIQEGVVNKGGAWILKGDFAKNATSAAKCHPGDIVTFDYDHNGVANHVGIIEKVSGSNLITIEGNYGDKVSNNTRSISSVWRVARPKWPDGNFVVPEGIDGGMINDAGQIMTNFANPEQLYSSDNFEWVAYDEQESETQKAIKEKQANIKDFLQNIRIESSDTGSVPDVILGNIKSVSNEKKRQTRFEGQTSGSNLPSTINYVEAPYAQITLGGVTIGTYKGKGNYPNYINSLTVKKTNGSLNEYTINLVHQIAAGDNPNYIDNLISANGYNKIRIEYGDAEAGISYSDVNALLINAQSKFDFFNNCINYTLYATSSSIMSAVNRRNYPAVTDKPSNIINQMLYTSGELLQYFPGMKNKSFVSSNNLIPSNDVQVSFDAVENTTPLSYLNTLVSAMKSITGKDYSDCAYYLTINDDNASGSYFKIEKIKTKINTSMFPLVYEIDINYPDENSLAYNFSVDTDYAWPLAYEYAGSVPNYSYNINNLGNIIEQKTSSNLKMSSSTSTSYIQDKNWWTNVTEFPITATLELKGITTFVLLLNYIKVNVFYFGNKRNSSGLYIVTGQEDSLSGDGFRTKLNLLRVAGDNQYITVDGRVIS